MYIPHPGTESEELPCVADVAVVVVVVVVVVATVVATVAVVFADALPLPDVLFGGEVVLNGNPDTGAGRSGSRY